MPRPARATGRAGRTGSDKGLRGAKSVSCPVFRRFFEFLYHKIPKKLDRKRLSTQAVRGEPLGEPWMSAGAVDHPGPREGSPAGRREVVLDIFPRGGDAKTFALKVDKPRLRVRQYRGKGHSGLARALASADWTQQTGPMPGRASWPASPHDAPSACLVVR